MIAIVKGIIKFHKSYIIKNQSILQQKRERERKKQNLTLTFRNLVSIFLSKLVRVHIILFNKLITKFSRNYYQYYLISFKFKQFIYINFNFYPLTSWSPNKMGISFLFFFSFSGDINRRLFVVTTVLSIFFK